MKMKMKKSKYTPCISRCMIKSLENQKQDSHCTSNKCHSTTTLKEEKVKTNNKYTIIMRQGRLSKGFEALQAKH